MRVEPITLKTEDIVQIQIHTDHIEGHEVLANQVSGVVEDALSGGRDRFLFTSES